MTTVLASAAPLPDLVAPPIASLDDGYRTVFERNPSPMWVFDVETHRFLAVNAAAVAEYGYPPEQFLTLTLQEVYQPVDLTRPDGQPRDAQELYTGSWVHRRHDGTLLQVEIRSNDLWFQGRSARLIHVTNVTARLAAEAARHASEQRLAAMVESSGDAMISKTRDGTILTWNAAAERMYGYTAHEAIGAPIRLIVPLDGHQELADSLDTACTGAHVGPYDTKRVHKDGHVLWVSVSIAPILNSAGDVVGLSATARDMTRRKALEDQLAQAHKMEAVGRLAGGVAHDFNNLLTVILGYCQFLKEDLSPADPHQPDIAQIHKAGSLAAALTRQLLAFSRKQIIEPTRLDLNMVVSDIQGMLGRLIGEDVAIVLAPGTDLASVTADRGQVEQIVLNLAVNARDAMPSGGTLTIETANVELDEHYAAMHHGVIPGPYVVLTVTDTGAGITPEVQARLFEPFFTTKARGHGTGLGLATVHGIATGNGGSVNVYSEIGKGTAFKVYFPRTAPAERIAEPPAVPTHPRTGTQTVLIVEDADGLRELARRMLQKLGYTVLVAASAADARRLAENQVSIDVLLTDVVMPGGSGPELSHWLLENRPSLKVVYMSGYTEETIVHRGILDPGIAFLHKPFTADALARKLRAVLEEGTAGPSPEHEGGAPLIATHTAENARVPVQDRLESAPDPSHHRRP